MFELIPYNLVLLVHITAFFVNISAVIIADVHAAGWVLGKLSTLPTRRMCFLHRFVQVGLVVSIASGFYMFYPLRDYLLTVPAFYVKIAFVLALLINAGVIGKHLHIATSRTFAEVTGKERRLLIISGAVSTISWVGVFTAAQFLGF